VLAAVVHDEWCSCTLHVLNDMKMKTEPTYVVQLQRCVLTGWLLASWQPQFQQKQSAPTQRKQQTPTTAANGS
jgi:hypothetical protein